MRKIVEGSKVNVLDSVLERRWGRRLEEERTS
jgi:hypothetical protein